MNLSRINKHNIWPKSINPAIPVKNFCYIELYTRESWCFILELQTSCIWRDRLYIQAHHHTHFTRLHSFLPYQASTSIDHKLSATEHLPVSFLLGFSSISITNSRNFCTCFSELKYFFLLAFLNHINSTQQNFNQRLEITFWIHISSDSLHKTFATSKLHQNNATVYFLSS